ncbi:DNA primase [Neisseria sp. Ec49-e6-T10]|uniref:DNA primase n=1 Tax=Neisseria sp. Ec49-e6-T10 TaxID=3140744 RepID=UPI003EBE59F6
MIPADFIDELLSRVDIVDIIEQYVPLKRGGQNYMACCPFHKEKSPSFTVSPSKQFYHCFGCGAHGSAIGFLMNYQGTSFVETVQNLANQLGMSMPVGVRNDTPQETQQKKEKKLSLESVVEQAAVFYQKQLKQSSGAIAYLKQRGLSGEIAAHYQLGFAPDVFDGLSQIFDPYPSDLLVESGLVIEKDQKHYDRFRGRIMFPIKNQRGATIGFGGRILDKGEPKYLNSPETPLFSKGRELYGLYEARSAIKEHSRVLVVEGYMDVVALAQFGIGYAVACLGTATTSEQIKLLMRQSEQIYFCFDGDAAGQKAAWRALENALPLLKDGVAFYFLFLPEQHDPDSYIRAFGQDAFEQMLLEQSLPLSAYFIQYLTGKVNLSVPEGKADLIKQSAPLLGQIKAPALGFLLKQRLSELVAVDLHDFELLTGTQKAKKAKTGLKNYRLPVNTTRPRSISLVHNQIKWLLMNPSWAKYVIVPEYIVLNKDMACLVTLAEVAKQMGEQASSARLIEYMRGSEFEEILESILPQVFVTQEEFNDDSQEALESFIDGIEKLLVQLKLAQVEKLKLKAGQGGLTKAEEKLMLALLMQKKQ